MQKFKTLRFGLLEYSEDDVLYFPKGIPGFDGHKRWLLLGDDDEGNPIKWLQSLEDSDVALPVMPPEFIIPKYDPQLCEGDIKDLKAPLNELCFFVVVAVPENAPWEATANVRAPIVINIAERLGKQVIGQREDYGIRHYIFDDTTRENIKNAFLEAQRASGKGGAP